MVTIAIGLLLPFLGTLLGSAMVFIFKDQMNERLEKLLLGFASGVMIAASIWSLIIPSLEMAENHSVIAWIPAAVGFLGGIFFLLLLDTLIPHLHLNTDQPEGLPSSLKNSTKMVLAITLHNIPEGMAVGVVFAGMLSQDGIVTLAGAFALSIGIMIQNFPEGAIVSLPLKTQGCSRLRSFAYGTLSGIVEPLGALLTMRLTAVLTPILPYLLSFAAGSMIYVIVEELIPEAQSGQHSNISTIGVGIGFVLMMILDVALG